MPAASPLQMVANAIESAELALSFVSELRDQGEYAACLGNISGAFRNLVFAALVEWRHNINDPRPKFAQAVALSTQARRILLAASFRNGWKLFHFPIAAAIAYLIDGTIDAALFAELPPLSRKWALVDMPALLDTSLLTAIRENRSPKDMEVLLGWISTNKHMKPLHREFSNYFLLLKHGAMHGFIKDNVRLAEKQFLERKHSTYYHSIDGGSLDNTNVVDFRLAAILKFCQEQDPEMRIPDTIHRWRW